MKNVFHSAAVSLMTAVFVAGVWTSLLASEGMMIFWICMLCVAAILAVVWQSVPSRPWSILFGVICGAMLLGIPAKLVPATNLGFGSLSQTGGLTLTEATMIRDVSVVLTLLFFLVHGLIEAFKPKQPTSSTTS